MEAAKIASCNIKQKYMQFLFPVFLVALISIAIPIIIHLFHFRRFKKVYFTNVRFLKEVKEETWTVFLCGQAKRANKVLSKAAQAAFAVLLAELNFGPETPKWPHYSKLGKSMYHCHLKRGKPTYVAC